MVLAERMCVEKIIELRAALLLSRAVSLTVEAGEQGQRILTLNLL